MSNQNSDITVTDPILMDLLRRRIELPHHENSGLVVLVRGKPGTGKSTLPIHLLDMMECAAWNDRAPERHYCTI